MASPATCSNLLWSMALVYFHSVNVPIMAYLKCPFTFTRCLIQVAPAASLLSHPQQTLHTGPESPSPCRTPLCLLFHLANFFKNGSLRHLSQSSPIP